MPIVDDPYISDELPRKRYQRRLRHGWKTRLAMLFWLANQTRSEVAQRY
jgi:hypothetical protein